ncbi:hypothetical protein LXL04_033540 [Taraxacum kok-saghyz]
MTIATVFIKEVVRLHGFPTTIISDRDHVFMSLFWKELFRLQGTELRRSTAYHPQTDGQTEIINKSVELFLRCFVQGLVRKGSSESDSYFKGSNGGVIGGGTTAERDTILDDLKGNLLVAQQKMKKWADKNRKEVEFEEGSWVYLKLQPYRQHSVAQRLFQKLAARFYGPYFIGAIGGQPASPELPAQLTEELELNWEPEAILGVRTLHEEEGQRLEVLVKWRNVQEFDATWEDYATILGTFPNFDLEVKVRLWERGNVMHPPIFTYKRRKQ